MRTITVALLTTVLLVVLAPGAGAQAFRRSVFNVGGGVGIPIRNTSDVAKIDGNLVTGGGVNIKRWFGLTGEFMWHGLPPTDSELAAVLAPSASSELFSVTGNFIGRYGADKRVGAYVIGGGGWYHHSWDITTSALVPGTVCGPAVFWYGVVCANGLVPANAVLRSGSQNGGGLNIGGGITLGKEGHGPKFYTEIRYHHAYFSHFGLDVLPVTFGIRW